MAEIGNTGAPRPPRPAWRSAAKALAALAVAAILATVALVAIRHLGGVENLLRAVKALRVYGYSIQFGLIALLWWRWAAVVEWVGAKLALPQEARLMLLARRHTWTLVLVAFQAFLFIFTAPPGAR